MKTDNARLEAETNDIHTHRCHPLESRIVFDKTGKVMRLFHVAGDHPPEAVEAVFLDRHPDLESAELARELQQLNRQALKAKGGE